MDKKVDKNTSVLVWAHVEGSSKEEGRASTSWGYLMLFRKTAEGQPREGASAQTQWSTALFHLPSGQSAGTYPVASAAELWWFMSQIAARIWGVREEIRKWVEENMEAQDTNL